MFVDEVGIAVLLLLVLAVLTLLRASAPARGRRRNRLVEARAAAVADALGAGGFAVEGGAALPAELTRFELGAPRLGLAPPWLLRAAARDCTLFVFDQEVRRGRQGWNQETVSDSRVYRHTLVGLRSERLRLPSFDLVPSPRGRVREALDGRAEALEGAGFTGHEALVGARAGRWMLRAADRALAVEERGGALDLDPWPAIAGDYRMFGEPGILASLLVPPLVSLLRDHPGMLVSGEREWLLVSRNVGIAYGSMGRDEAHPFGLLTPGQAAELAAIACRIEQALRKTAS